MKIHSVKPQLLIAAFCLVMNTMSCSSLITKTTLYPRVQTLNQILDRYFEAYLKLDPLFATSIGDHRYDAELEIPLTDEHHKKEEALLVNSLKEIRDFGCRDLPESELNTCLTFESELASNLELLHTDLDDLMSFNQFQSFFMDFAELASGSSYVTFNSKLDYENFMSRMKKVPEYFEVTMALMQNGIKKRITIPNSLAIKGIKNLKGIIPALHEESVFYKPLHHFPKTLSKKDQEGIKSEYQEIIESKIYPAYQKLLNFVEKEYLPKCRTTSGVGTLPGGRPYYMALVKHHTTTQLSPNQIMAIGLQEVARIRREFEAVKKKLGFQGSLTDFFKNLRKDPALFPFKSHEAVLAGYEQIHQTLMKKVPSYFHLLPKSGFEIREVEKFKAETSGESYQNPSEDGSRPGIFWVPIPDPAKYQKKSMEALFLHEAIPGHHFQISLQQESDLPRYRKFNGNNAYVEGWGLYSESLGKELGLYQDPYEWVGRLEYEMHRALRLVLDTGIHWKGWTRERAIQYSMKNEPLDEDGIIAEVERYMAIPGQALAYKLGELKIQELKRLAQSELGARYQDPQFHDEILKDGPLSLSILETKIRRWIEREKKPI